MIRYERETGSLGSKISERLAVHSSHQKQPLLYGYAVDEECLARGERLVHFLLTAAPAD